MNLDSLQQEVGRWALRNFPDATSVQPLLGIGEEVGELDHAFLKRLQGIRTNEDHDANIKDAVADIIIFLAHFCALEGISLDDCVNRAWEEVKKRDWRHEET